MRKLHLNHNIYGAFFVLVIMGLTAVTYFTTSINQQTHTVQSQAAGTCGNNCDNKSVWISDCLRYNGSDKTAQCNDWFNAECSSCGNSIPTPAPNTGGGNNNGDNTAPFDPTATANDSTVQNLCGANPNDPRCCKINEWKNANLGTNFKVCSGSTGGTGGTTAPTAAPTLVAGTAGSCNNGQIPNGSWACFSTTKVVQCINGKYQNETNCTSCKGISTNKSSICTGSTPSPGQCDSPEIWCATLNKCTGRTSCPAPTSPPGQCDSPEIWCATLNKCTGRTSCPTPMPTPVSQVFLPLIQNNQPTAVPTSTGVQTANPNACGQPGAACCSTVFGESACVTNGYECIAGKCRVGYVGFDDSSVTQVQTRLQECTTGVSGVQCSKPEIITVQKELTFNGCAPLINGVGFMCAE